ncbi:ketopantoate reductase family protein [Heyndrickxia sp. NPDC080065]|uniref:ketopantoate reductase family protein n=1 Tax=Heyndrickxia sp. NPDC080065 TaxID=3390568 RepID=UPI003D02391D
MRILVVGAGAIGGYFGGRLLEKGEDVTFLVRSRRFQQLTETELVIESPHGNMKLKPKLIMSGDEADPFDIILLSTKAYHLDGAIESIRPYMDEKTMILPLLNGIEHINQLILEFGEKQVIGGLCFIETTLDIKGNVIQTSPAHNLVYGELNGEETDRMKVLQNVFSGTKANFQYSPNILQAMWDKYLFISTLSGITTLTRAPIGPIRETAAGKQAIQNIADEVISIMESLEAPIETNMTNTLQDKINTLTYNMKSSMQRDMEKGLPTEADHFFHYLLNHANKNNLKTPNLQLIYTNLKVYERNVLGM